MTYDFAALRFTEDKNISDKVYWYLCEIPVKDGDRVLAPVGMRDRLQAAVVEQTFSAQAKDAPYDLRLMKSVAAKCGARKLVADGTECLEFGGVRYDEKHYTPYGKILLARSMPKTTEELKAYGVTDFPDAEAEDIYEKIARAGGCVLLCGGAGERVFQMLLDLARGINKLLYDCGADRATVEVLKEKLQ